MEPGTLIGERYRITATIGNGGFGTTFAAVDVASGRAVAIKRLDLRGVADWKSVELFQREAAVLRRLAHPRIPAYVDFVPLAADRAGLLIQELAPGRSLAAVVAEEGRLDAGRVIEIADQVLEILGYLGGLSPPVVHRDVKPANLMLDEAGVVRLVDFGAVRDAAARASTIGSTIAGTFGFMAPELLAGGGEPRSDLYSLGMTMIALLSGLAPTELPQRRLRPDYRARVEASDALCAVIDRLTEPVPEDRFPDARAARRALAEARAAGEGVPAPTQDLGAIVEAHQRTWQKVANAAASRAERARLQKIRALERRPLRVAVSRNAAGTKILVRPILLRDQLERQAFEIFIFGFIGTVLLSVWGTLFLGVKGAVLAGLGWWLTVGLIGLLHALVVRRRWIIELAASGHFAIYRRTPRAPDLVGKTHDLRLSSRDHPDELQDPELSTVHGGSVALEKLTLRDVQALRRALGPVPGPGRR